MLLAGDPVGAEAALRRALAFRPEPACRARTYGVRYVDYLPYYYLGLALEQQGRLDEAREAFTESARHGVASACPASPLVALDLAERLARLGGRATSPDPASDRLPGLESLVADARAAGAEFLAPDELASGLLALERARGGDALASGEAEAALTAALFRARAEQPLVALLRREALEEMETARLLGAGLSEGVLAGSGAAQALAEAESLLDAPPSAATALAARRAAARARQALETAVGAADTAQHERVVRARAQAELLVALATDAALVLPADAATSVAGQGARADLAEARRLATGSDLATLQRAAALAERARGALAELARRRAPNPPGSSRAVLELLWSDAFGLPPVRVPSAGTGEEGARP
jgi:hypothetical protein